MSLYNIVMNYISPGTEKESTDFVMHQVDWVSCCQSQQNAIEASWASFMILFLIQNQGKYKSSIIFNKKNHSSLP